LHSVGDRKQPCLAPTEVGKHSLKSSPTRTMLLDLGLPGL
jgi:hypothetical protein